MISALGFSIYLQHSKSTKYFKRYFIMKVFYMSQYNVFAVE